MRLDGDLMSQKMVRDCEGDALEGAENTSKSIQNICTHLHCLQCKHLENFSLTGTSAISAMFDFRLFWLYFIDSSLSLPWGFFIVFCWLWIFFLPEVFNLLWIKEFLGNRNFSTIPRRSFLKKHPCEKSKLIICRKCTLNYNFSGIFRRCEKMKLSCCC